MILNYTQLQTVNYKNYSSLKTFSRDINMVFGVEKCKTLSIVKGKPEVRNFTTEDDDDTMEAMNEEDIQILGPHAI
jgi:hypothetical protein